MKKNKSKKSFKKYFLFLLIFILAFLAYSYFIETKNFIRKEYPVINSKIPDSFNGFKIVHLSDLHYKSSVLEKELKEIVDMVNKSKPDLVVFTGDLLDKRISYSDNDEKVLINNLKKIDSLLGVYIVKGNHDNSKTYDNVIKNTGFNVLDNKNEFIYCKEQNPILLLGYADSNDIFEVENINDYYSILLSHEPDNFDKLSYKPDLFLAGHSHNGQIRLPFIGSISNVEGAKKYYDEKYIIDKTTMYISSGLGTSKINLRCLDKPSFNFYRLYSK